MVHTENEVLVMRRFLYSIKDAEEYLKVLALLSPSHPEPLTVDDARELVDIYNKYNTDAADLEFVQAWLTIDATVGKSELKVEDYTTIGLNEPTISAIFEAIRLAKVSVDITPDGVDIALRYAHNAEVYEGIRVALARLVMDILIRSKDFFKYQTQVADLTDLLVKFGTDAIDHYATLIREVQLACVSDVNES